MRGRVLLVGTDLGVRGDDAIVEGLRQLAAQSGSSLHVLHAIDPSRLVTRGGGPLLALEERALADVPAALERRIQFNAALNGVPYCSTRVHAHVRLGRPVETLLQACVDFQADLLILGPHGRRGFPRLLLGSVADQLLRQAHCPVLVARPKNYHGLAKSSPG